MVCPAIKQTFIEHLLLGARHYASACDSKDILSPWYSLDTLLNISNSQFTISFLPRAVLPPSSPTSSTFSHLNRQVLHLPGAQGKAGHHFEFIFFTLHSRNQVLLISPPHFLSYSSPSLHFHLALVTCHLHYSYCLPTSSLTSSSSSFNLLPE